MNTTTNLNLLKPEYSDTADIEDINDNMDTLDGAIGALPEGSTIQGQIDDINVEIGNTALPTTAQTLTGAIAEHETDFGTKLNKNQGSGNSGKVMVVDEDGEIVPTNFPSTPIDDTKGIGDTDFVWSADKDAKEVLKIDGTKADVDSAFAYKETYGSVVEFDDGVSEAVKQMRIDIAPNQDLHGYSNPWVGGAGKNLLPRTGSASVTIQGVAWSIRDDGAVIATRVSTSSSNSDYSYSSHTLPAGSYVFSCFDSESTPGGSSYQTNCKVDGTTHWGIGTTSISSASESSIEIVMRVYSGFTGTAIFKPMVRLSTETDSTFEPYSNICPISGWTGAKVYRSNTNLYDDNGPYSTVGGYTAGKIITLLPGTYYLKAFPLTSGSNQYNTRPMFYYKDHWGIFTTDGYHTYDDGGIEYNGSSFGWITGDKQAVVTLHKPYKFTFSNFDVAHSNRRLAVYTEDITTFIEANDNKSYEITFPSTAGTVYGGTLTVNQDGTGSLVVDRAYGTLPDCYSVGTSSISGSTGKYATFSITGMADFKTTSTEKNVIFEAMDNIEFDKRGSAWKGFTNSATVLACFIPSSLTKNDVTALISGTHFVAKLASPTSYTLTTDQVVHLLSGQNTVYADCGDITLLYPTDKYLTAEQAERERIHESITVSAHVQTINDGADNVPMDVTVGIEPVQDLRGYSNPWVGGAGRNLCPDDKAEFTLSGESWVSLKGVAASTYTNGTKVHLKAGTYKRGITNSSTGSVTTIQMFDSNGDLITVSNQIFTLASEGDIYIRIKASGSFSLKSFIESDTTATVWTPYENICPISGWNKAEVTRAGKNLLDQNGTNTSNGYVNDKYLNGSGAETSPSGTNVWLITEYTKVKSNTQYTASGLFQPSTANLIYFCEYDKDKNFICSHAYLATESTLTFTTNEETRYVRFSKHYTTIKMQLEEGSTATTYEPFGHTYSITFPSSAGTVYGGSLTVNKDGTGTLVVDHANAKYSNGWGMASDVLYIDDSDILPNSKPIISSLYECDSVHKVTGAAGAKAYPKEIVSQEISSGTAHTRWLVYDTNFATADAFNTYIASNNLQIVYELATPITYTVPSTVIRSLLGTNNIWADTGNILSLNYSADTKMYIDNKFTQLQALILENIGNT